MAITAADVKKLRDATGAGMMDAKKALTEAEGDHEKAIELLRISGLAKAAKRTDREATNGIVAGRDGILIQFAAETDFVAKNAEFVGLGNQIVDAVAASGAQPVPAARVLAVIDVAQGVIEVGVLVPARQFRLGVSAQHHAPATCCQVTLRPLPGGGGVQRRAVRHPAHSPSPSRTREATRSRSF